MRALRVVIPAMLIGMGAVAQTPAAHVGSAVRLMQDRRYSEAAVEFEKALALNPDDDGVRIQYATCLYVQERNDDARAQFEIEQRRRGDRPGFEYYLGQLDLRSANFNSAIARLRPLASNPAFPMASFYLGLAYLSSGKTAPAMENLERAAKNNPRDADVHYRLARVYSMADRGDDAEREYKLYRAARESERIVEQDAPACMDALRTQPIDRAREVCGKLADPGDSRRLILLGQLYAQALAFSDAVGPLQQAAKLEPQSFEAWHYLGLSLFGLKQYKEAVAPLQKAAGLNPQYFDTLNLLAKTLYSLGDYAAALPVLERAHDLNPGDIQLAGVLERLRATLKAKP
jgi:tetratricopeptide (TPR) repeat protein